MRSAPPLQLSVNRYGVWRAVVLLLVASAGAAMLAWWWAQPVPVPQWASVVAAAGVLVSAASAAGLWRTPRTTLRWERQRWWVTREGLAERAGDLAVAIDLGGWILLRFVPEGAPTGLAWRCPPMWIALQRRGLEAQWHTLRCALYCARPALEPGAGAGAGDV